MAYTYGSSSYCSTYNNTAANKYSARLGWELQSQDIVNNTSTFKVILQAKSNDSAYYTYGKQTTTIDSVSLAQATFTCKTSWITLGTRTITIAHNDDGSFPATTISGSFTTNVKETYSLTGGSASVTIATDNIETIERESDFTLTGSALGSAVSVTITRQNDLFTHKVEYSFAGSSYTTATSSATTSASFTPALSLASNIPNSTSGTLTVRVTTFNGSTQVGSSVSKTLTLSLPTSAVPTFTSITASHSSTNSIVSGWGIYVKGYSKAVLTINEAAGVYGSNIVSYSITGGGFSGNSNSLTTGLLNTAGTITFTATITDSRGRTASKTETITVIDYSRPSISVIAERCNASGVVDDEGTSLKVTPTYLFSPVSNGTTDKNSATVTVTCNNVSETSFDSGVAFTLAANVATASSYTLTATITDSLGNSATATASIPNTEALPLHIKGNKKGIGLGTTASTDSTVEIGWPIDLNGNKIEGLLDLVYPVGAIYMSVNSTSPATLFGGTWAALGGQFLLAASSTYTAGSTGGAASTTLTTANLPSHTHSVGAHAHGLNSHTHGVGTLTVAETELTGRATFRDVNVSSSDLLVGTINGVFSYTTSSWSGSHWAMSGASASGYKYQHLDFDGTHTHTISGATAAASGSTANSSAFNSGATGSGSSFTNLPPYLAVYMWKRTA